MKVKFTKNQRDEISQQVQIRIDSVDYPSRDGGILHEFENSEEDMVGLENALDRNTRSVFTDVEIDYMILLVEDAREHLDWEDCSGGIRSFNNALHKMGC
jgi:hypothetical protein